MARLITPSRTLMSRKAPELAVVQHVKVLTDVSFQHVTASRSHQPAPYRLQSLVGRPFGTESIGAVQEILFVDCFQHHGHRFLQDLILQGGYADGPGPFAITLGNVHPLYRRSLIGTGLEAVDQ